MGSCTGVASKNRSKNPKASQINFCYSAISYTRQISLKEWMLRVISFLYLERQILIPVYSKSVR